MKILYIGNYRDQGSFGRVCRDYLLALIEAGADVVARPVLHSAPFVKTLDPRIQKVEAKSSSGAQICIQQVNYTQLLADTRFEKNVAILGFRSIPPKSVELEISDRIAPFDDIICTNFASQVVANQLGGVVYQHPVSNKLVSEKIEFPDRFVFYFIGKLSHRKNLDAIVTAFHREFSPDEPVELLIKTSCDIDPNQAAMVINNHLNQLKTKIGKYKNVDKYKREKILLNETIDEDWGVIHNSGNCLVMASAGEYTSLLPSLALKYGNEVIANDTIGISDFSEYSKGVNLCGSNYIFTEDTKCANLTNFEESPRSKWYEISTASLQSQMRNVFSAPNSSTGGEVKTHQIVGQELLSRILK